MAYFGYLIFRFTVFIFSLIPFRVLYVFSNILALILPIYRKKVVLENLHLAFPEKSEEEIEQICQKFYAHLCDVILEVIKGFSISEQEIRKRFSIDSTEITHDYLKKGKNIIALTAHYNNWEWGALGASFMTHAQVFALYKPLSNRYIDAFVKQRRKAWGCNLYPLHLTNKLMEEDKTRPAALYIFAADQSPSNLEKAIWVDFFGIETPALHGAEHYAKNGDFGVIFYEIIRIKRGFYKLKEVAMHYDITKHGNMTQEYMRLLEAEIRREPAFWLWSHRRWKHRRN